jgi:hypothetical protein
MNECTSLTSIHLPPTLTSLGNSFMSRCYNLNNLDLSNLTSLETIGIGFMYECTSLTSIHLPLNLISISTHFMNRCYKLKTIDFLKLKNLTSIGDNFMDYSNDKVDILINNSNKQIFEKYKKNPKFKFWRSMIHLLK